MAPAIHVLVTSEDWRTAMRSAGDDAVCLDLYVEPGASGSSVGPYDPWRQRIKVRVDEPATGGRANEKLARLLGETLGVPPRAVRITRGATTRRKTVQVEGVSPEAAGQALAALLEGDRDG